MGIIIEEEFIRKILSEYIRSEFDIKEDDILYSKNYRNKNINLTIKQSALPILIFFCHNYDKNFQVE